MKERITTIFSFIGIAVLIGIAAYVTMPTASITNADGPKVTIYKSPNCGCCVKHSAYLKQNGFDVDIKVTEDMDTIKQKYGIPYDKQSCHTTVMGDYFVEGHVPVEAFRKLLEEKPDIDGIGLPEMPSGSPGMPGPKLESFEIYQLKNGKSEPYINL